MFKSDEQIIEKLRTLLDAERFGHSLRVQKLTVELASHHKVNPKKASIAGLLHDCSRFLTKQETITKAEEAGLHIESIMRFEPKLLHAPLAGYFTKTMFGIDDPEILTAIERHTLGSPQMTALDKILYVADHVEPERSYQGIEEARKHMAKDLNKTISIISSCMIKYLIEKEMPVHPLTLETRNFYLKESKNLW